MMNDFANTNELLAEINFFTQEEKLEIISSRKSYSIGILSNKDKSELRTLLTPKAVELLVENNLKVFVDEKIGEFSNFTNLDYSQVGAELVDDNKILSSDIILKVNPLNSQELDLLKGNQIIFSKLYPVKDNPNHYKKYIQKQITAISLEDIFNEKGEYPFTKSMNEIAGRSAILSAAELLSDPETGKGKLLGGITGVAPANVVIIGAGTAGISAYETAEGLNANVKVFDNNISKLHNLKYKVKANVYTSVINSKEFIESIKQADIIISTIAERLVLNEKIIKDIPTKSIIIDIGLDKNICSNSDKEDILENDILYINRQSIPSRVSYTASNALSNIITPKLLLLNNAPSFNFFLKSKPGIKKSIYFYNGIVCNKIISNILKTYSRDIDLLLGTL